MKTAGSTFGRLVRDQYRPREVYPRVPRLDPPGSYFDLRRLLSLPPERHDRIRVYSGHFPYFAAEVLPVEVETLLILREPVARTVSWLRQRRAEGAPGQTFEQIYEDDLARRRFLVDHQTKVLSLQPGDRANTYMKVIDVDRSRLDVALARLEQVSVLGVQERFDEFVAAASARYGWAVGELENRRVATDRDPVPDRLVDRIREDVALDADLYARACELVARP
jgi:hypothetical protein